MIEDNSYVGVERYDAKMRKGVAVIEKVTVIYGQVVSPEIVRATGVKTRMILWEGRRFAEEYPVRYLTKVSPKYYFLRILQGKNAAKEVNDL